MTTDPRMLGALRKTIVTGGNTLTFPTIPGAQGTNLVTAIIRALTTDVVLDGVTLKNDVAGPMHSTPLAAGCELVGVTAATITTGNVQVFFTTGA